VDAVEDEFGAGLSVVDDGAIDLLNGGAGEDLFFDGDWDLLLRKRGEEVFG
jgi:hypothetical protein